MILPSRQSCAQIGDLATPARDQQIALGIFAVALVARVYFAAPETQNETFRDFLSAQEIGVRGFPTLIAGNNEEGYALLTNGYQPLDNLLDPLERWWTAGAPVKPAA